jgi:hypothetical protein
VTAVERKLKILQKNESENVLLGGSFFQQRIDELHTKNG